jgi:hypothetical protein
MATDSPFVQVPVGTPMFNVGAAAEPNTANLCRTWILFFQALAGLLAELGPLIGFSIVSGVEAVNASLYYPARFTGTADVVVVVVTASDPSIPLTFDIFQNGVSVFAVLPTIPAGALPGTVFEFDDLVTQPLEIQYNDVFNMGISSGSSSWQFVAVVETSEDNTT